MNRPHLDFALSLHRELATRGNLVWSPFSVASALGLVAAGARGRTRGELATALAPAGELDDLGKLLASSSPLSDAEMAVANTLWARRGARFQAAYLELVRGWPGGSAREADFVGDPEQARAAINQDVARTTRDLIQDLLPAGAIQRDTAAVIVNALYLRVAWHYPFLAAATRPAPFHAPGGTRQVPTMRQRERLGYAATEGWRMVALPTASDVVVDVLLPPDPAGPALPDRATLTTLYGASRSTLVELALPRFRVETPATLNDPLGRLGVRAAFTREADFSGITESERLVLDRVAHKAVLTVDEQGFEGAAATAAVMRTVSMETGTPVRFPVDRPFLVVVRHGRTGAIFFLAWVQEP